MAGANQNTLLKQLMEHACALGMFPGRVFTAERYVLTLLEVADGTFTLPSDPTLTAALDLLRGAGIGSERDKARLLAYINDEKGPSFRDEFQMRRYMSKAEEEARRRQLDGVTPDLLLDIVLKDQNGVIRLCCAPEAGAEIPTVETKQPPVSEDKSPKVPRQEETIPSTAPTAPTMTPAQARKEIAALTERVKSIHARLSDTLFGQDNAVSVFTSGYFQAELLALTDKKRVRPSATYLFAGPPGVGKTFLAESAAAVLGLPFQRFDMSEYCDKEASVEFCGSDKVYRNGKAGNFTSFVSKHKKCVVLFDEIEKAHISIIHQFLQILDAGRIRDNYTDEEIALKDVIMIFTTNAGRQLYAESESGDFSNVSRKVILKALQKDVDPRTGVPYFPEAICSRFASGNVVMFNHIAAHDLRRIAKREVQRHAANFEREVGVTFTIDERVPSALLFAEGGAADARTVRARAESFFDDELFELFRLMGTAGASIENIERVRIGVDLPKNNAEITELFENGDKKTVLLFTSKEIEERCAADERFTCVTADGIEDAEALLRRTEVDAVLIDPDRGLRENTAGYLNIEDVDSDARDFFRHIRTMHASLPVYMLAAERTFDAEERASFMRQGARGFMKADDGLNDELAALCNQLHQQQTMLRLARANKLVTFETAQRLSEDGKTADIRLFDFRLITAMDAEDASSVLSGVSKPNVRWDQVIGADDAKRELKYFVEYLKNPKKYLGTGVRPPKGVLLYGPPGTGKTLLAKAMAGESDVTFISAEGNQFLQQYVGKGSAKVHELFRTARKYAPSILFIDEIDAIAKERTGEHASEDTLTAFLTEMDGFKNDTAKPVFVLAATNFDVEPGGRKSLDPALMRRFDRRVYIDLPNRDARVRYMKMKMAKNPAFVVSEETLGNIAVRSTGMSLAELESVLELSLRSAIREGTVQVTDEVLQEAFETFNSGEKKKWDVSLLTRVARHEAGHAFLCWYGGETPSYLTVVARAGHGGYMQHGDHEGKALYTKEELLANIRTSLGGRAAELVYYGDADGVTTGAASDLQSATRMARRILCSYGMDERFGLAVVDDQTAAGELSAEVRDAVNAILNEQLQKTVAILCENRAKVDRLVDVLIAKNHLTGDEIEAVLTGKDGE